MLYFTDQDIDQLIAEDVPYFDITTSLLRLENKPAKIQVSTREPAVVCCTEEIKRIFNKTGIQTTLFTPSGEYIDKNVKFLEGEGLSGALFAISRTIENLLRYASGIATRTHLIIGKAREANPAIVVATTRDIIPYTRKMAIKAVKSGGGAIYRFGLSESVLIYRQHYGFLGGPENLEKRLREQRTQAGGRIITVEADTPADAVKIARSGIDVIHLSRFTPGEIKKLSREVRRINPGMKLAASGEIDLRNVQEYARSGADILVTSYPYYGEPAALSVTIQPIFDPY